MSKLRYPIGLYGGKAAQLGLRLLRRQGTYLPGVVSGRLDPQFLKHLPKPRRIIAVTGTNGKTTTSNMLLDVLRTEFPLVINNNVGSNTLSGILTTLAENITMTGRKRSDVAILEVDERWTPKIFPQVIPEILVITNLFQDSYKRNAHTDFIRDTIEAGIPAATKLILNADDLISSAIGAGNDRVFFSIAPMPGEIQRRDSRLKDIRFCPQCNTALVWDFVRYHHLGKAHCPACGFTNPPAKYILVRADETARTVHLTVAGEPVVLPMILHTTEALYNQLAAYAALREFGLTDDTIATAMGELAVVSTRYSHARAGGKSIILFCAKRLNPIANSRVFDAISRHPGPKTVIIANDDHEPTRFDENLAWFYDTDFEYLATPELNQLIINSWRGNDLVVRALMAGIPEEKITVLNDPLKVPDQVDLSRPGDIFILHGIHVPSLREAEAMRDELVRRLEEVK